MARRLGARGRHKRVIAVGGRNRGADKARGTAVGIAEAKVDLIALKRQQPALSFAAAEDAALDLEPVRRDPAATDGVQAIQRERTLAEPSVQTDRAGHVIPHAVR